MGQKRMFVTDSEGRRFPLAEAARLVRGSREYADHLEWQCVRVGRENGESWGRLGLALGVLPDTLRRRYSP